VKASEFIREFQELIHEYGDLDVVNESDESADITYTEAEDDLPEVFVIS
jgi:hypothetical protein